MFNGSLSDGQKTIPLQAAHLLCAQLIEHSRPIPPDANKANSFHNPAGREPGRGWIVVGRKDLDTLNLNALQTLTFVTSDGTVTRPLRNLVITREPMCLSASLSVGDTNAAYLVELADSRHRVKNANFTQSIAALYNVPSTTPTAFLASSRNSGTDWTWATMIANIWATMTTQIGAYPGLPFTPDGAPVGWIFQGTSAFDALCDVLDRIGCTISVNLSATSNQLSIVRIGASDTANDAILAASASVKIHDAEFQAVARGKFPYGVRVFFHKQLSTPTAIPPFLMNSVYSVDIVGTVANAEPGVYHPIWDDLPALVDGSGTVTNTTALTARAQERADDHYRMALEGGTRFWKRFSGLLALTPGSKIKSVTYCSNGSGVYTDVFGHPILADTGDMRGKDYASAGTLQDLVRLGFPQTAGSGGGYHLGVSTTTITAGTPTAPGLGLANYWKINSSGVYEDTGITRLMLNTCAEIPAGWWLSLEREPFSGLDIAIPRCVKEEEGSSDSASESESSGPPIECCALSGPIPFHWSTNHPLFPGMEFDGTLLPVDDPGAWPSPFDPGWVFHASGRYPLVTGAVYDLTIYMYCDPDTDKLRVKSVLQWGGDALSIYSETHYVPTDPVDCDAFCFQAIGEELWGGAYHSGYHDTISIGAACDSESASSAASEGSSIDDPGCESHATLPNHSTLTWSMAAGAVTWLHFPAIAGDNLSIKWDRTAGGSLSTEVLTGTCPGGLTHAFYLDENGCYATDNWPANGLWVRIPNTTGGVASGRMRVDRGPDCVTSL